MVWLLASAACAPSVLRSQSAADSAALARIAARITADAVPAHAADSVVIAPPRSRWDSAVVRELRALRHWPPPADMLRALHVWPAELHLDGDLAILRFTSCRCEPEALSTLNWWRQEREYEYRSVTVGAEVRWERVPGRELVRVADGICARSARPENRALRSGSARC